VGESFLSNLTTILSLPYLTRFENRHIFYFMKKHRFSLNLKLYNIDYSLTVFNNSSSQLIQIKFRKFQAFVLLILIVPESCLHMPKPCLSSQTFSVNLLILKPVKIIGAGLHNLKVRLSPQYHCYPENELSSVLS
jgi:hypothetical protein